LENYKSIQLTQGQFAIVDEQDFERVNQFKWYAQWSNRSKTFYAARRIKNEDGNKSVLYMHRFILNTPRGFDTDHKDNNGLHNWKENLRVATRSQNTFFGRAAVGSSGIRGVMKINDPRYKTKKWRAKIVHKGKAIFLGCFSTAKEAEMAYKAKAQELYGEWEPQLAEMVGVAADGREKK